MPKHATNTETIALLTTEVGRVLDGRAARIFDGHLVVDFTDDKGRIGGRILHAHDNSEIATFTLTVGAS